MSSRHTAIRKGSIVLLILFAFCVLPGCSGDNKSKPIPSDPARMNAPQYSIGVPQGTAAMTVVEKDFSKCKIEYYGSLHEGYLGVKYGKIDAFAFDRHALHYVTFKNPDLTLMNQKIGDELIVVGSALDRVDLMGKVNAFIRKYRADGTYQDMYNRWLLGKNLKMPDLPEPQNPTMTLKIGTDGRNEPMNFYADDQLTGFDIEFAKRLGIFLNAKIVFQTMEFTSLIAAASTGKIDLLVANLNGTAERRKMMLFSDNYMDSEISFLVRKDRLPRKEPKETTQGNADSGGIATGRVGAMTGSVGEFFISEKYPKAQVKSYENIADAVAALQGRKLDYVITAYTTALNFAKNNSDLTVLPDQLLADEIAIGVARENTQLLNRINDILARFKKDGSLDRLIARWIKTDNSEYEMAPVPRRKDGKVLRVAISANREPVNFVRNNTYTGLDCELIERIAYELGMRVEFYDMNFSSLVGALQTGKADVVISNMTATKERKEKIHFTEKYFDNPQVLLVKKAAPIPGITDISELADKKVGITTGSSYDSLLKEKIPRAIPEYFNNFTDQISAVKAGKIAGLLVDEPIARDIMSHTSGLTCMKKPLRSDGYAFAFSKNQAKLHGQVNAILKEMAAGDTFKKLDAKWFGKDQAAKALPDIRLDGRNGVIRFVTNSGVPPFVFMKDGKIVGYDIEIAMMVAQRLGKKLEIQDMDFAAIIPSLVSGKSDMAGACISITEERAKSLLFSIPDYKGGVVVMVASVEGAPEAPGGTGFWPGFVKSFERTFVAEDRYKLVLRGLWVTIVISILSAIFGALLGFGVCMMRRAKTRWANIPAKIFIRAVQGTPIVVLLMILYYIVFGGLDINAILVAVIGFSLNFAAYVSEMMRTGIDAVDKGQHEAAYAIGFNKMQVSAKITFPQAARHVLPVFKGEFISMVKMTSIVGYIAIQDLTKVSDIIRSRTYEAFFPLIATALIYFVIAYGMTILLSRIEMKVDPKQRKRVVKGVARP